MTGDTQFAFFKNAAQGPGPGAWIHPKVRTKMAAMPSQSCVVSASNQLSHALSPLAARSARFWLGFTFESALTLRSALALKIERHGSADKILQCRFIDLFAFADIDSAPDIPLKAGVK